MANLEYSRHLASSILHRQAATLGRTRTRPSCLAGDLRPLNCRQSALTHHRPQSSHYARSLTDCPLPAEPLTLSIIVVAVCVAGLCSCDTGGGRPDATGFPAASDLQEAVSSCSGAGGVWLDPSTGLLWQNPAGDEEMTWDRYPGPLEKVDHKIAVEYCDAACWSAYDDWRLPNISELRSLVRPELSALGSVGTELDGTCEVAETCAPCGVSQDCLTVDCLGGNCYGQGCYNCSGLDCLIDPAMGVCPTLWSSSRLSDNGAALYLDFLGAGIHQGDTGRNESLRCVRGPDSGSR